MCGIFGSIGSDLSYEKAMKICNILKHRGPDDGDVWLDKRQVDPDSVRANIERLLTEQPTDYVIIQADIKAKHGLIVEIMDQVKIVQVKVEMI